MNGRLFDGFSQETFAFLAELARNNQKVWFQQNKERYRNYVQEPAEAFADALSERFKKRFPGMKEMHGKVFRIYRDTRFSRDKTPYKTHIGVRFSEREESRCSGPVFYVHLDPGRLVLVTGVKEIDKAMLSAFRSSVADVRKGKMLEEILSEDEAKGFSICGERGVRVPAGFAANHPRAALLKAKGLYLELEMPLPPQVHKASFTEFCLSKFSETKPLYDWFSRLPVGYA